MLRGKNNRKGVRLNVDGGVVVLRSPGRPALACAIGDLSEGGCGCRVLPDSLSRAGERWSELLATGTNLEAELDKPPHLNRFLVPVQVCHVQQQPDGMINAGLLFVSLTEHQRAELGACLMGLASTKIKRTTEALPRPLPSATSLGVPPPPPPPSVPLPKVPPPSPISALPKVPPPPPPPAKTGTAVNLSPVPPPPRPASSPSLPKVPATNTGTTNTHLSKTATAHLERATLAKMTVAEVLSVVGKLSIEQAKDASTLEKNDLRKHCRYLAERNWATTEEICQALSLRSGLPVTNLEENEATPPIVKRLSYLTMMQHEFVPFTDSKEMVCMAAAYPLSSDLVSELSKIVGKPVLVFLAPMDQVRQRLFQIRPRTQVKRQHERIKAVVQVAYQFCDQQGLNIGDAYYEGLTRDISEGGFLIVGPAASDLDPKDLLRRGAFARIEATQGKRVVQAMCKLRRLEVHVNQQEPNLPWLIGLETVRISPDNVRALREMCIHQGTAAFHKRSRGFDLPGFSR